VLVELFLVEAEVDEQHRDVRMVGAVGLLGDR